MIDISIIYPKRLFVDFYRSIKDYKTVFFFVPILIGMFMAFLIDDSQKDSIDGLINSSLTSFVPIFATILSVYISWVFAKRKTRHDKERIQIFQETTNAIFVLIPLVLFAIGSFFMSHMSVPQILKGVSYIHYICHVGHIALEFIYYTLFTEIALIIFMITKRSYVIIINEIRLLEEDK